MINIGAKAFENCSSIESISLPFIGNKVDTTYVASSYYNCFGFIFGGNVSANNKNYLPTTLKKVKITGESIITTSSFEQCDYIEEIELSDNVIYIESLAFRYCDKLKSVIIGNGVKTEACNALTHPFFNYTVFAHNEFFIRFIIGHNSW